MLKAIAIDDEPIALEVIKKHAQKVVFLEVTGYYTNVFEASVYLQQEPIDLLFLDIQMPDLTGIDLVNSLPNPPMIIFTTAYSEYAVQGFELDAVDYLLKPFNQSRFLKACNKAYQQWKHTKAIHQEEWITIKSGYEQIRVKLTEIWAVESVGNYMKFILQDQQILSRLTLKKVQNLHPQEEFIQVHRSFIVAKSHLTKISSQSIFIQHLENPHWRNL